MFFIFGSSGFIGSKLKERLIEKFGRKEVFFVGRKYKNKTVDLGNKKIFEDLPRFKYKNIYILAGKSDFIFSNRIAEKNQVNKNIKIVKKIIKFCKNCKVERVFFFSSSAIYSIKNKLPYRENQTINPNNSLGKSKYRSEKIIKKLFNKSNTKVVILRIFTVYGNNMRKTQFLHQAIKKFKSNKRILTFWNKDTLRNFIHIDDLLNIIVKLSKINTPKYTVYNIASNKSYKIKTIVKYLNNFQKKKKKIVYKDNKNNLDHVVDISKIKKKISINFKNFKRELFRTYEEI